MEYLVFYKKEGGEIVQYWNVIRNQEFIRTLVESGLITCPDIYREARRNLIGAWSEMTNAKDKDKDSLEVFPNKFNLRYHEGHFLVLQWSWERLADDPMPPRDTETSGWIVAREIGGLYYVLSFNEICDIVASNGGWDLIFGFKVKAIKQAVKDVNGIARALLTPRDGNPLTMVIQSPQPYHGAGMQIADQIETIRDSVSNDVL